jgi:hypothetical protein
MRYMKQFWIYVHYDLLWINMAANWNYIRSINIANKSFNKVAKFKYLGMTDQSDTQQQQFQGQAKWRDSKITSNQFNLWSSLFPLSSWNIIQGHLWDRAFFHLLCFYTIYSHSLVII